MKVCVIRNAQVKSNANMLRVTDALLEGGYELCLLSRTRYSERKKPNIIANKFNFKNQSIDNFEIQLPSEVGKGISNIIQLAIYQIKVFRWLLGYHKNLSAIHSFDLDSGLPALLISKIFNKKFVYHIADFYVDSRPGIPSIIKGIIRRLEYMIIRFADITIICTEERKEQISGSKPNKLLVIHNTPIQIEENVGRLNLNNIKKDRKVIKLCYVGGLDERRFIKTVIRVISEDNRFELEIAGMGTLQKFVEESASKYPNIFYHGIIDYYRAIELYSSSDIMFAIYDPSIPNHRFTAPNKVYESMMLGKPIIVSKNTGIDKLVNEKKIGVSIDYSEKSFKDALEEFHNNSDLIYELGMNSKIEFEEYKWEKMRLELIQAYDALGQKY